MTDSPASAADSERLQREADILSQHLDSKYTAAFDGGNSGYGATYGATDSAEAGKSSKSSTRHGSGVGASPGPGTESDDPYHDAITAAPGQESSLRLPGGDMHRDLYRITARTKRERLHQRAATFSHPSSTPRADEDEDDGGGADHRQQQGLHAAAAGAAHDQPGGFRRQFLLNRHHRRVKSVHNITGPITHNFVSFLDLYGSFAGEDLVDDDEEDGESAVVTEDEEEGRPAAERRPLLPRRRTTQQGGEREEAGTTKTFFTLLKAFIGTGIMFLPKAFNNGGILFSSLTLVTVSVVTMVCFRLLLQCRHRFGGSYGSIGAVVGGRRLQRLILVSITVSQLGFVCAGIIFVAENLMSFLDAVTRGASPLSASWLIGLQAVLLVPLAFIRNISKLGPAALLADACILLGLAYIYWYDVSAIVARGGMHPTVQLFNPRDFTLTIGSSIFTFEGIGLILPIQGSMKHPEKFGGLLLLVMSLITVIFTAVGALSYATFGAATRVEIIDNFPQTSRLVNAVQFLYSLAVLVGNPVQLFPAVRIMEGRLFRRQSGKQDVWIKVKKNGFRTGVVALCILVSAVGAGDLDKFVALIGAVACVPLVYIYPPYLHWRGIATSRLAQAGDVALMALGLVCMVYTTCITIKIWVED